MSKAILLLHGFATDKTDFDAVLENLKAIYDYVECPNLPGHDKKGLKGFTKIKTIEFIEKEITKLEKKYDIVDILGFSMGGALASYLASRFKVRKLILLAPANAYINTKYPIERIKKFLEYIDAKWNNKKDGTIEEHKILLKDDSDAFGVTKKYILPNYNLRSIKQFIDIIKYCKQNTKKIDSETLVILGDIDQLVPDKTVAILSKYCKNMNVIKFKNLSHMMLRSKKAKMVVKTIIDFIKEDKNE